MHYRRGYLWRRRHSECCGQRPAGRPVSIGIIPMGSGNGLALAAKIPKQTRLALDLIFTGNASPVDAFYINDKFSCMLCGIGFDAAVAHEFAKQKKRGLQTYIRISTIQFFKSKPYPFEIILKDRILEYGRFFYQRRQQQPVWKSIYDRAQSQSFRWPAGRCDCKEDEQNQSTFFRSSSGRRQQSSLQVYGYSRQKKYHLSADG